jgi:hypothetical protein
MSKRDPTDVSVPPAPKRRRWLLGCGLLVLLLFAACGGLYGYFVYRTDKDVREAEAEANRLEPDGWRLDEIEARRKVIPDEENAALVVMAMRTKLPKPWPPPRPMPAAPADDGGFVPPRAADPVYVENELGALPPEVQLNEALLRDLRADLDKAKDALAEAQKLPTLRSGRFPIQYTKDYFSTIVENQVSAREAARLMQHQAVLLAQEGKADKALEATRGVLVAGRSVGDEPLMISMLIRIACSAIAAQTLERILAQGEPSADELKKTQELLEAEAAEPLLLNAIRGERAGSHGLMVALKSGDAKLSALGEGASRGSNTTGDEMLAPVLARASHATMLRWMTEFVEITKLPPEAQAEPLQELEQKVKRARTEYRYDALLATIFMPALIKVSEASRRVQANLGCAIVAVAAERYRRDHGSWPAKIDELKPAYIKAVPTDPYDGQPLRYKRLPDGAVVYSVGPDKRDDGGARNRANHLAKGTDYIFRLWDVNRHRQPPAEVLPQPGEGWGEPDGLLP